MAKKCSFCEGKKLLVVETTNPEKEHPGMKKGTSISIIDFLRWINNEKDISKYVGEFVKSWMRVGVRIELCPDCKQIRILPMKQKRL